MENDYVPDKRNFSHENNVLEPLTRVIYEDKAFEEDTLESKQFK